MINPEITTSEPEPNKPEEELDLIEAEALPKEPMPDYRIDQSIPLPATETGANFEQMERIPSPRTEAARALTAVVNLLVKGQFESSSINKQYCTDHIDLEYLKALKPQDQAERDLFFTSVKPTLIKFEKLGLGSYQNILNAANPHAWSMVEGQTEPTFTALYIPWEYGSDGSIKTKIDISVLTEYVESMSEDGDSALQIKNQARLQLDTLKTYLENEKINPTPKEERFEKVSEENLTQLKEDLDLISENMIESISAITTKDEADGDMVRRFVINTSARISILIRSIIKNTDVAIDTDRTQYPEFWEMCKKHQRIYPAIGTCNTITGIVRHDIEIKY
jgi:hypothetical protein